MRTIQGFVLILASSAALADGYGLVAGEGPGSRPVGGADSQGGYGLLPSAVERQGVQRMARADSSQARASARKNYLVAADRAAYVVPAARPALQPARRPVVHQPVAAQPQPVASRYSSAPVANGRYSQVQMDTRKQYSVSVSAQRPLSDLMRAPVTFAKPAPQPVRSLSQLQAPAAAPAVASAQPVLPANVSAAHLSADTTSAMPDFSALKARLKNPPAAAAQPATTAAVSSPAAGMPDFSALKARLKQQPAAAAATTPVAAAVPAATGGPDFSALKARLKNQPAQQPAAVQPAVAQSAPAEAAVERRMSALPGHGGRRSVALKSGAAEQPLTLTPVTTTATVSRSGINGLFDAVANVLGAEPVKPWQKASLAEQSMKKGGAIPALSKFSQKVHISKEASRGGYGVAGGGCGCN